MTITYALRSPDDPHDYIYEHLAKAPPGTYLSEFPQEYDLRCHSQTPRQQGARGTCAAFTAAAIKEIQEKLDQGFDEWMSPEFIYYHRANRPAPGMYGRNVFQVLQQIGSVPESMYSYKKNDLDAKPPSKDLYSIAAQYRIANFARVTTCDGLKRALLEIGPCYMLLPLYSFDTYFWRTGDGESVITGHAVTVVGYNREGFIIRNSWGADWNGNGHIIFPYNEWGSQWECWVCIDDTSGGRKRRLSCTVI